MKSIKYIFIVLIVSYHGLQFSGCTALGLWIGLNSDASQPVEFNQATYEVHKFDPGTSMDVFLINGDSLSGEFLSLDSVSNDEYAGKYENYRNLVSGEITLPRMYDSIAVNQNARYDYNFLGFDFGCMTVNMKKYNKVGKIYLKNITHMYDSENNRIEGEMLRKLVAQGDVPLLSDFVIITENTEVKIPAEDLLQGKLTDRHYGWLYGLSAGLLADAFFVFYIVMPNIKVY